VLADVAYAELARELRIGRPVEVERAHDRSARVQIAVAAGPVLRLGLPAIRPLRESRLAPELCVAVIERGGDDVVVGHLVLRERVAVQLGLLRAWIAFLIHLVAVGGQPEAVAEPGAEVAAAVGRVGARHRVLERQARRGTWLCLDLSRHQQRQQACAKGAHHGSAVSTTPLICRVSARSGTRRSAR
jgi:hypothetical protein